MSRYRQRIPYIIILVLIGFLCSAILTYSIHLKMYANTKSNGEGRSSTDSDNGDAVIRLYDSDSTILDLDQNASQSIQINKTSDGVNEDVATRHGTNESAVDQALETNNTEIKNAETEETKHKFAYAYLVAGCNPEEPNYRGYIYSVAVAKELFTRFGSKHDIIVHIRMHAETKHEKLPPEDENILTKSGFIIKYLPKPPIDNFHTAMMDKFRILQLTEYKRVLYLDADVIPLNNLDYVFELSTPSKEQPNPPLEENLILAYNREPSSGGFFMMSPKVGDYEAIQELVERRNKEGYHFNETVGWGHQMVPPDGWESLEKFEGSKWDFYGAFTDQGLIYMWTKYVQKKVTICNGPRVKTYKEDENGIMKKVRDVPQEEVFGAYPKRANQVRTVHHSRPKFLLGSSPPYRDFHHFKEYFKPWVIQKKHRIDHGPHEYWFKVLKEINERYEFGINVDKIGFKKPNLGLFPTFNMVEEMKEYHKEESSRLDVGEKERK